MTFKGQEIFVFFAAIIIVVLAGLALVPTIFTDRVLPGVKVGTTALTGVPYAQVPGALTQYSTELAQQRVMLAVRGQRIDRQLQDFGLTLDAPKTTEALQVVAWNEVVQQQGYTAAPAVRVDRRVLYQQIEQDFASVLTPPQDATLTLAPNGSLLVIKSKAGEGIDIATFEQEIRQRAQINAWEGPVELTVIKQAPEVLDNEVEAARTYANQLLQQGLTLHFEDKTWSVKPFTVRRLLEFVEVPDPKQASNHILAVQFNRTAVEEYLGTTISPEVNQAPQNARFERDDAGRVLQFSVAQRGQAVDVAATAEAMAQRVAERQADAPLKVVVAEPIVSSTADIERLGIGTLLARGETDFAGSPRNRTHNITVGTSRYHGLLIPPSTEFSFNEHLGPVDGAHGFKPELVIKKNVTIPEFGGGLCQVSTTLFRGAVYAGLEISQRRNHAYAVSYYGTPGFDATIYPPYTDLRFINNTPGYILIQARVEGTKVIFEFWGTKDGRVVEVAGPVPYDRQSNGAVKATLKQTVIKNGEVMIDETFYSRYQSPQLFPKVVAANAAPSS